MAPIAPDLAFRYRSGVTRTKLVDLGIELPGQSVVLVVTLTPKSSVEIQIRLHMHPTGDQAYLPNNLSVKVFDGKGAAVMKAHVKTANTHITLEFSAQLGEHFRIRLQLGDMSNTSNFVV